MNTFPLSLNKERKEGSSVIQSSLDSVDQVDAKSLRGILKYVVEGGKALVEFVDYNRDEARRAGVESLAVELSGILAARRLDDIQDALSEVSLSGNTSISKEGLSYLRRAEKLLAEANSTLLKITGSTPIPGGYKMGANISVEFPTTGIIVAGVIIAIGVVAAVILSKKK